jgi:hypothetical protein
MCVRTVKHPSIFPCLFNVRWSSAIRGVTMIAELCTSAGKAKLFIKKEEVQFID